MNTETHNGWVLIKTDGYLAIPTDKFLSISGNAKNIKVEWASKGSTYHVSRDPMPMMFMTDDQMTALLVRDRLTQASEPDQSGQGCSTSAAS